MEEDINFEDLFRLEVTTEVNAEAIELFVKVFDNVGGINKFSDLFRVFTEGEVERSIIFQLRNESWVFVLVFITECEKLIDSRVEI